ncbi:GNAT family N-acetyltransferase [Teichococcus deserti]|uniref:GNAT family N-acetyltransferase n=1 Tax=Teichococcus deserti TaxID=1817963 RepID=UPI0009FB2888|nr:GNAT family protein [Pseudoroseomonas deserti]
MPLPGMSLRDAIPGDAPALADIDPHARQAAMPGLPEPWRRAEVAAWLQRTLMTRHRVCVAVGPDGAVLGDMGTGRDAACAWQGLRLLHLYPDPGSTGRGIGAALRALAKVRAAARCR